MLPGAVLVACNPPLGRYSLQAPRHIACGGMGDWWCGEDIFPPAQEFGKRGGVFRILMPTAPTRINYLPRVSGRLTYSDKIFSPHYPAPR